MFTAEVKYILATIEHSLQLFHVHSLTTSPLFFVLKAIIIALSFYYSVPLISSDACTCSNASKIIKFATRFQVIKFTWTSKKAIK